MIRIRLFVYPMIATLSLAAAFAAHAETPEPVQLMPAAITASSASSASSTTRAAVMAEFREARRTGAMRVASTQYNPVADMKGSLPRELVRAETLAMNQSGHARDMSGEDSGSFVLARAQGQRAVPALTLARR